MNPGKYNIDVEALNCVKDKNGYCIHNPPKLNQYISDHKSSTLSRHSEEMTNAENESENCARINSVAKWPTVSKRIWKLKQKTNELTAKKMRLNSEVDTLIDLGTEDLIFTSDTNTGMINSDDDVAKLLENTQDCDGNCPSANEPPGQNVTIPEPSKPKNNYVQFHSAHFDIRSSPIKPSSTVFRKFQINPSKNYQVQVIRSLEMVDKDHKKHASLPNPDNNLQVPITSVDDNLHVTLQNSDNRLNATLPSSDNGLHATLSNSASSLNLPLSNQDSGLHVTLSGAENGLHVTLPNTDDCLHVSLPNSTNNILDNLPSPDNGLHVTLPSSETGLNVSLPNTNNSIDISLPNTEPSLHDIFKDDVDLACKEDSNIDPELKDWIISTSEKSQEAFTKPDSLIEPVFLNVRDSENKSLEKNVLEGNDMPSLDDADNRLLSNQGNSVLNFLETLGNDLVYPETEIRNNAVDFQLDLFTFHNS